VYRSMAVGLSMLRGGVLRSRCELGQTRRPIGRGKNSETGSWIDGNPMVGDRGWQYVHAFCEGAAIAKGAIHAGSTDGSAFTSQNQSSLEAEIQRGRTG